MKTPLILLNVLLQISMLVALIGCGTKTGTGRVDVSFANNTAEMFEADLKAVSLLSGLKGIGLHSNPLLGSDPTVYGMTLVAFYLVEEIDGNSNNVGAAMRIWSSHKCDADLTLCGIGPAAQGHVVDYFDFAQGSAAVNQMFNNFRRDTKETTVNAGTYRYLRMDFQGATGSQIDVNEPTLIFGENGDEHEVRSMSHGFDWELPEPLVVKEGDSVTVTLSYDLNGRYYENYATPGTPPAEASGQEWNCDGSDCVVEVEFTPTVSAN